MVLLDQFREYCRSNEYHKPGETTLLTVSGGVDSMVMAHLYLSADMAFGVAHCNFGLRGSDSDGDEQFVKEWCKEKGVTFFSVKFDTREKSEEWKKGTQETARILRYEWFEVIRRQHGFSRIATAHHANDNVETLLINLFRGTGISGLHGILPESDTIIRPMLFVSRKKIEAYAGANNIYYREDASNTTDDYLRNAVRHNIVPVAEQLFPGAVDHVSESIRRFAQAEILYRMAVEQERKKLVEKRGQDHYIPILNLRKRPAMETLCYELFLPFGFGSSQLPHILRLMDAGSGHFISSASHRIIKDRGFLIVTTLSAETVDTVAIDALPCVVDMGRYSFSFSVQDNPGAIPVDPDEAWLDIREVAFPLMLRKWRQGDYLYPFGMGMKKKKVSRLLIDAKVPLHEKEQIYVLESARRLLWIAGIRTDERFRITESTEKVLVVRRKNLSL